MDSSLAQEETANEAYRYPIASVENAAKTLMMLRTHPSLQIVGVAKELGTARSTAHRMVSTLLQEGLLARRAADRTLTAGPALIELARAITNTGDLRTEIEPLLRALATETGETTHFLTLHGTNVLFVAGVESEYVIRAVSRVGHRLPSHVTSAGKALLATLSTQELAELYPPDGAWTGGTTSAIHDREHLLAEVAQIQARGWALNNEESEPGLMGVSMAVRGEHGSLIGGITVSGPAERVRPKISATVEILRRQIGEFERTRR